MNMYQMVEDAGHGWVKVPMQELIYLGIIDKITVYSHIKGNNVWLEEDCDATTWIEAKAKKEGKENVGQYWKSIVKSRYVNHSRIRSFPPFVL
jgi:hypothetical protein